MSSKYLIYGLKDPTDGRIRYVGKSSSYLYRPRRHCAEESLSKDNTHKGRWLRQLLAKRLRPEIIVLEDNLTPDILDETEKLWIELGRFENWGLTNICDGGEGRQAGYKCTPETNLKISKAKLGRPRPDLKAYNTARRGIPTGRSYIRKDLAALNKARSGVSLSPKHKQALRNAHAARHGINPKIRINLLGNR